MIEALLEKPYWVIDFLPEQVPANSAGQFFAVEEFYLTGPRQAELRRRFAEILLKVNCYYDLAVCAPEAESGQRNPAPERLFSLAAENKQDVCVLLPDENALFTLDRDDTHMTVFNPSEHLLRLLGRLAAAEGLFLWQPPQKEGGLA